MNIPTFITSLFSKNVWEIIQSDAKDNRLQVKALDWHLDLLVSWILQNAKQHSGNISTGYHLFGGWSSTSFSNQPLVLAILKRWLAISESPSWKEEVIRYLEYVDGKENANSILRTFKKKTTYGTLHEIRKNPKAWEKQMDSVEVFVQDFYGKKERLSFSKTITLGFYTLWLHQRSSHKESENRAKDCSVFIYESFKSMPTITSWDSVDVLMLSIYMYAAYQQFYDARFISLFVSLNKVIQEHVIQSTNPSLSGGVRAFFPVYAGRKPLWISTEATVLALECFVKEKEYCGC